MIKISSSTQSNIIYSNTIFKQYLIQISNGIIWKNTSRANENESTDLVDTYQSELFVVANRGLLNFEIIKSFPRTILLNSGIPENLIEIYATDKRKIPVNLRGAIVAEYVKALTSIDPISRRPGYLNSITGKYETIYTETNNYYRMLMGLPNKEDHDYIYNTDSRWSTSIPIHELPYVDRIEMERDGILDELLKKYPSKEYIAYLGKRYIDPFTARISGRFEILYHNETASDVLNADFMDAYNNAREMVLSVYYNNSLRKTNDLYDNFLAMCILFMTLQIMQYKYLQVDITRDFYDTESLKLVYDSYGVPFYSEIPLEYHRKIVKNINKLISYKGSSKVFFDLFNIFDLGTMDIYSYFLIKTHILDENGIPLFNIKKDINGNEMYDSDGNPILDESNYKIRFSRAKIYDDPSLSVSDEANNVDYWTLTNPDPYWIEDAELIKKLANEDFNYLESKYLGIQTVFDLMKITYENAYIFRLITDNKELTDAMEFRWTEIGDTCSLFDIFIYLSAIYCRYYGYEGIITNNIPAIMDTIGYNFDNAYNMLKQRISNDPIIESNTELMNLILNMNVSNLNSIDTTYETILKIQDIIIDGYTNSTTIEEFQAYRDLYNTLLISKEITNVYTNPETGEIYETFVELLSDTAPVLMQRYLLLEDSDIKNEIVTITNQIESLITSLKYLDLSTDMGPSMMIESLFKILKFFKSAKAELVNYNIIYTITMRGINFFKMMDVLVKIVTESKINDYTYFVDILQIINDMITHKNDVLEFVEEVTDMKSKTYLKDYINKLTDEIVLCSEIIDFIFKDETWYIDFLEEAREKAKLLSILSITDISNPSLVSLDILEAKYKGLYRDEMNKLTDRFIAHPEHLNFLYIIEVLNYLDKLHLSTEFISSKKLFSMLSTDDNIEMSLTESNINDLKVLIDILKLITSKEYLNSSISDIDEYLNNLFNCVNIDEYAYLADILQIINDMIKYQSDIINYIEEFDDTESKTYLKDYINKLTDEIVFSIVNILYLCKDDVIYNDIMNTIKEKTKLLSKMVMEDSSDVYLLSKDDVEYISKEKCEDSISRFADSFKEKTGMPDKYNIFESLSYIDNLHLFIQYTLSSQIKSISSFSDNNMLYMENESVADKNIRDIKKIIDILKRNVNTNYIESLNNMKDYLNRFLSEDKFLEYSILIDKIGMVIDTLKYYSEISYNDSFKLKNDITDYNLSVILIDALRKSFIKNKCIDDDQSFFDIYLNSQKSMSEDQSIVLDYFFEHDSNGNMKPVL